MIKLYYQEFNPDSDRMLTWVESFVGDSEIELIPVAQTDLHTMALVRENGEKIYGPSRVMAYLRKRFSDEWEKSKRVKKTGS